jgi:hypothetical protein
MKNRALRIALATVGGITFAIVLLGSTLPDQIWIVPNWLRILIVICAAMVGTGLLYLSLGWVQDWRANYSRRNFAIGLLICLLAGLFLAFVIPVRGLVIPLKHTLQLISTTEKNEKSQGNDISLKAISSVGLPDQLDLQQACSGDWVYQDGAWVSQAGQSTKLVCQFIAHEKVNLQFAVGDHSGVVMLVIDQLPPVKEDLYADSAGMKGIPLSVQKGRIQTIVSAGTVIAAGFLIGWMLFVIGLFLIQRPSRQKPISKSLPWFVYALPLIVVWLLYLIAFWPGFMNSDAQDQWRQMATGRINDWHPAFHTLTFWLITRAWFSPAAVALTQVLILAVLIGLILAEFQRRYTPLWLNFVILLILCLPPYGLAVIALWKDIPYSIAVLGFTFCLLLIAESEGRWIENPLAWIGLGLIATLAALYRHNGPPGVFITLGLLVLVYPRYRKYMLGAFLVAVLLFLGVRGPLYRAVGVAQDTTNPGLQLALAHLIAAHTKAHTPLLPEERRLLGSIRDGGVPWPYNCYDNNKMAFDGNLHLDVLRSSTDALIRLSLALTRRNPSETLDHFICNGAFIFRILPPMAGKHYAPYDASPIEYYILTSITPQNSTSWPGLRDFFYYLTRQMYFGSLYWFFWRSPFWMYLLIFAASVAAIRTTRKGYYLLPVPVLLNTLPLALVSFVQGYRFVMPVMLVSLLFSGYLLFRDRS